MLEVMKEITVPVNELQPGDFVIPANAYVKEIDCFAGLVIVEFTDKTATAPIPNCVEVNIYRDIAKL